MTIFLIAINRKLFSHIFFKIVKIFDIATCLTVIFVLVSGCDVNFNYPVSNDQEKLINFEDNWKFSIGDDSVWSSQKFNDESWDEIIVPSSWENEGFHGYNGYAWYRKHFTISQKYKNNTMYVSLGYIDDVDETYINGKLIGFTGTFPPFYETAYNVLRNYSVPAYILNFNGDNVISVRVFDAELEGGILHGDIGLFTWPYSVKKEINLEGDWKFSTGDNLSWGENNFDDKNWMNIIVPGFWESQGYREYDGYAWYRKKVYLPSSLKDKKLVLVLGKIDDVDQTFLNGKQIGNTGQFNILPEDYNQNARYRQLRGYYIPNDLIRYGRDNVIAIRIYDGFKDGGIYEGPIGIVTQENYRKYWNQQKAGKNIFEELFGN